MANIKTPVLRKQIEATNGQVPSTDNLDEDYTNYILALAYYFLKELDTGFNVVGDSATELGDRLYKLCKEEIPEEIREELTGNQVMEAAYLAYRAFVGD